MSNDDDERSYRRMKEFETLRKLFMKFFEDGDREAAIGMIDDDATRLGLRRRYLALKALALVLSDDVEEDAEDFCRQERQLLGDIYAAFMKNFNNEHATT